MENTTQPLLKLEGVVEHMIYENAETGYAVFEVNAGDQDVVVAGNVGSVDNGMNVTVYGHMVNHPSYGEQFRAESCEASLPQDTAGLLSYLSSGVLPYIGPSTAKKNSTAFRGRYADGNWGNPTKTVRDQGHHAGKSGHYLQRISPYVWCTGSGGMVCPVWPIGAKCGDGVSGLRSPYGGSADTESVSAVRGTAADEI